MDVDVARDRRALALAQLQALGAVLDHSGSVLELSETIRQARRPVPARFNPNSQCRGKRAHASRGAAEQAARRWAKEKGAEVVAYGCPHCGKWHVGSALV